MKRFVIFSLFILGSLATSSYTMNEDQQRGAIMEQLREEVSALSASYENYYNYGDHLSYEERLEMCRNLVTHARDTKTNVEAHLYLGMGFQKRVNHILRDIQCRIRQLDSEATDVN